ncbi:MAG TPA: hypothetical protein PL009_01235 [Flavipsychrobacter sp.]|nr:hypothetical protein [Flavipsychrobacter sp.]
MRSVIIITKIFLLFGPPLFAQSMDYIGKDSSTLNMEEANLLNSILINQRGDFDFNNKKVVFITGSTGNRILTKSDYFQNYLLPWIKKGDTPSVSMVRLTDQEKCRAGYDVLIISWVKIFTDRQKKKIIKELQIGRGKQP